MTTPTHSSGPRGGARITCPCGFSAPVNPAADSWKCKACKRSWPTHPVVPTTAEIPKPSECESCGEHVGGNHIRIDHPRLGRCVRRGCLCPKWQPKALRRERWAA